jgi:hypothetical protein
MHDDDDEGFPHAKMVKMERMPAEDSILSMPMGAEESPKPHLPYGLRLSLDAQTLKMLGIGDDMPAPEMVIEFCAAAVVVSASKDPSSGNCCVELQITEMGLVEIESKDEELAEDRGGGSSARRQRFYGEKAGADKEGDRSMAKYDRKVASYNDNREAESRA